MNSRDPKLTALQFNNFINQQDSAGLANFMTPDHAFIDRHNKVVKGKDPVTKCWREFFRLYPEYRNTFLRVESIGELVVILGYATWTKGSELDHAIWTARIENDLVAEWRVYYDTPQDREKLLAGPETGL